MGRCPRIAREHGFTIVEVMVAMVVLLVGMAGTATLLDQANLKTTTDKAREGGVALSRELVEASRSRPYDQLTQGNVVSTVRSQNGFTELGRQRDRLADPAARPHLHRGRRRLLGRRSQRRPRRPRPDLLRGRRHDHRVPVRDGPGQRRLDRRGGHRDRRHHRRLRDRHRPRRTGRRPDPGRRRLVQRLDVHWRGHRRHQPRRLQARRHARALDDRQGQPLRAPVDVAALSGPLGRSARHRPHRRGQQLPDHTTGPRPASRRARRPTARPPRSAGRWTARRPAAPPPSAPPGRAGRSPGAWVRRGRHRPRARPGARRPPPARSSTAPTSSAPRRSTTTARPARPRRRQSRWTAARRTSPRTRSSRGSAGRGSRRSGTRTVSATSRDTRSTAARARTPPRRSARSAGPWPAPRRASRPAASGTTTSSPLTATARTTPSVPGSTPRRSASTSATRRRARRPGR